MINNVINNTTTSIGRLIVLKPYRKLLIDSQIRLGFNIDKHYVYHSQQGFVYPLTHQQLVYYKKIRTFLVSQFDIAGLPKPQYFIPLAHRINWNHYSYTTTSESVRYLEEYGDILENKVLELETHMSPKILDFNDYEKSLDFEKLCQTLQLPTIP